MNSDKGREVQQRLLNNSDLCWQLLDTDAANSVPAHSFTHFLLLLSLHPFFFQVRRYVGDMVKLYSVSVTNVLDGVASECRACALVPQNSQQAGSTCVPCPAGFYIDSGTNRCQECPPNTHLSGGHTYGLEACMPCGPGSRSNKVETLSGQHCGRR